MTAFRNHRGFMLITVLIVTAIGLLFGAGALLLFRYQCQLRIDRQHELKKLYAVRSALNYIRTAASSFNPNGTRFGYPTSRTHDLGVIVKPVAAIFPSDSYKPPETHPYYRHFFMERGMFTEFPREEGWYEEDLDYEYGAIGVTNWVMSTSHSGIKGQGLVFTDLTATNHVKWWVNIGMRDTGGWLQQKYGRRYYFNLSDCIGYRGGNNSTDVSRDQIRLCIIRNVTNESNNVGRQHGWPLSLNEEGVREKALVFETSLYSGDNAVMRVLEYEYGQLPRELCRLEKSSTVQSIQTLFNMGLQIAGNKVSLFYIDNSGFAGLPPGFIFSEPPVEMSPGMYEYFFKGALLDDDKEIVQAPELRAVFEVEASSSIRTGSPVDEPHVDFITGFRVEPAYQYDVYLQYPPSVTNLATVAQKIGLYSVYNDNYTVLTYDTHGTENKGFRKDERDAERKRNGQ